MPLLFIGLFLALPFFNQNSFQAIEKTQPVESKNNSVHNKMNELIAWRNLQKTEDDHLIVNTWGNPINVILLDFSVRKLKKIDPEFRLYHCRYTTGWRAYKKTKNIYAAQQLLRHENPRQTIEYLGIQKEEVLREQRKDMQAIYQDVLI